MEAIILTTGQARACDEIFSGYVADICLELRLLADQERSGQEQDRVVSWSVKHVESPEGHALATFYRVTAIPCVIFCTRPTFYDSHHGPHVEGVKVIKRPACEIPRTRLTGVTFMAHLRRQIQEAARIMNSPDIQDFVTRYTKSE